MQTEPIQLARQQFILSKLGYYRGPIDGVWGKDSIEAKKRFENRPAEFRPARPNAGLPFGDKDKLPASYWAQRVGDHTLFFHSVVETHEAEWAEIVAKLPSCCLKRAAPPEGGVKKEAPAVEIISRGGGNKGKHHQNHPKSQGKEAAASEEDASGNDTDVEE